MENRPIIGRNAVLGRSGWRLPIFAASRQADEVGDADRGLIGKQCARHLAGRCVDDSGRLRRRGGGRLCGGAWLRRRLRTGLCSRKASQQQDCRKYEYATHGGSLEAVRVMLVATLHCTTAEGWGCYFGDSLCISWLTRSTSRKTRIRFPPRIFLMSSALYPRSSSAWVIFGRSAAESMPVGVAPLTPSKSEPSPT